MKEARQFATYLRWPDGRLRRHIELCATAIDKTDSEYVRGLVDRHRAELGPAKPGVRPAGVSSARVGPSFMFFSALHVLHVRSLLTRASHSQLPHHEQPLIDDVAQAQVERLALAVAGLAIDPQQHGLLGRIGRRRRLQRAAILRACSACTRVSCSPAVRNTAGYFVPGLDVVVRRVGAQERELLGVLGRCRTRAPSSAPSGSSGSAACRAAAPRRSPRGTGRAAA